MIRFLRAALLLLLLTTSLVRAQQAQQTALVKGRLILGSTADPATDVQVTIPYLRMLANTDADGTFSFARVPFGTHVLVIGGTNARPDTIRVVVNSNPVVLQDIRVQPNDRVTSMQSIQIPTIALEETDGGSDDDGVKSANVSGLLTANRDPFLNTAAFVFGPYRFQPRGYDRSSQQVLINGAPMNDVETGDAYWSLWGGLNDVFRGRSNTYGLAANEYAYGGINGTVYFDATAANQRKQTRLTYSASNRQYRNRLMITHSSGLQANGWAYSASVSRRWADEGYIPGTDYNSYSYYLGISKRIKKAHTISFTTFGTPSRRGKSAPSFQEAYDLAGTNFYNPNWGYQNGEKRNAKVASSFQPVFLLNHEWTPNSGLRVNTVVGYQTGRNGNSTLDWYNAPDPRPDYYRTMPSFSALDKKDPVQYASFLTKKQIDWDNMYQVNYINKELLNGDSLRRSLYVVGNDVDEIKKWTFSTNVEKVVNSHISVYGGLSYIIQRTESYRELEDLLGGDFYRNINQFAERNNAGVYGANQNDANNPNAVVRVGDRYFYNYVNRFNKAWAWGQVQATYNKVDLFLAVHGGYNSFNREGLYRNGLFANGNESFGMSKNMVFALYGIKGGVTYKYNGRHYFFLNAGLQSDAPSVDNTFISPRTRNFTVPGATEEISYSAEGGYLHRAPKTNIRVVGYATDVTNATRVTRFFSELGVANTFVNYTMSGIAMRFIGTELAVEYKVSPAVTVTGVAALNQSFYTNNPTVRIYRDNFVDTTGQGGFVGAQKVYIKNYYVAAGPQSAYSAGINYRSKRYWYVSANGSYFARNYIDIAAPRRAEDFINGYTPGSQAYNDALSQEEFAPAFTVDVFGGKSFLLSKWSKKIPRNVFLYLNAGISNLFDNQNIRTGGFENLRTDDAGVLTRFAPKYFYAYGRNYFVNLSLKF